MYSIDTRPLRERPVTSAKTRSNDKGSVLPSTIFFESIYWIIFVAIVFFRLVLSFVFLCAILALRGARESDTTGAGADERQLA